MALILHSRTGARIVGGVPGVAEVDEARDAGVTTLRLAAVPGCYWPFRSFPLALGAGEATIRAALSTLAGAVNGLRIGQVVPAHGDERVRIG